jgi:ferrous iron transport protein A
MTLDQLAIGRASRVAAISDADPDLAAKLREIGFAENDEIEMLHHGPLGTRGVCVRLNRTLIALRPTEAAAILVADLPETA